MLPKHSELVFIKIKGSRKMYRGYLSKGKWYIKTSNNPIKYEQLPPNKQVDKWGDHTFYMNSVNEEDYL